MIDAVPRLCVDAEQEVLGPVGLHIDLFFCQVLEEVDGGALVEVLRWMFQDTEHDRLWGGAEDGDKPG